MTGWRAAVATAALAAGLASNLPAQTLSASLAAGGFFPPAGTYREIYGSGKSFAVDIWLKLGGPIGLAAGLGTLSDRGLAIRTGEAEEQPLRFRRTAFPLVAFYEFGPRALAVRLGAGAALQSFRETWQDVDLGHHGLRVSPRAVLAVSARLAGRISVFGSAVYDPVRAGADPAPGRSVSLGGFQLLGGLAFEVL